MKRILLVSMVVFSVFVGCNKTNNSSSGTGQQSQTGTAQQQSGGTLYYWSAFTGDSMTWDQWRVNEFLKENPTVKVEMQSVPESAGVRNGKLLAAIAGGTGPDLIVADDYIPTFGFVGQGAFEPWDPYLESIGLSLDSFMPGFRDLMEYNGHIYLLPQDSNVIMLYINTDMAAAAGLDINNYPKTIDELNDWTTRLTVLGANGAVERYGYIPWLDSTEDPTFWPFMFGAEMYIKDTNKLDLTDPRVVAAFNWQREFAQRFNPSQIRGFTQSAGGLFSPDHPFFTGKVAMTVIGNWATNALRTYAPNINYTCVPIPVPAGGRERSTPLGSNVFAIPRGAKNKELAAKFFKFTQDARINADNFDQWRSIPTVDAVFDNVSWTRQQDPIYLLERELANSPKSAHPALCAVSAQLVSELRAVRDDIIYNNRDPEPLLREVQNKLQPELDRSK
ncbi:hypothetical protein FACS1894172_08600 [Spirochaetia bacterium]|nr:hypothetical protein FACS1894164_09700 [Spirochaetia bacterium]GHU32273.1 hypothetical protein FACS1894172_08600 [Spirochaetia bacterium]